MKQITRLLLALLILGLIGGSIVYFKLKQDGFWLPTQANDIFVEIPSNTSFEEVVDILKAKGILSNDRLFSRLSENMNYKKNPMRPGRYKIKAGWSQVTLIRHLRNGPQSPVKLILNNERLLEEVAGKAAQFIEADSLDILQVLSDKNYQSELGFNADNLMSVFIPNTYEVYWNISPKQFMERMVKEHETFWSQNNRKQKATNLGLTTAEVYTLASIVEKETLAGQEKPRMAGVYLNRIATGMLLQADPTAVFARRDFDTPRVTDYHTTYDSPFNTYKYPGLPPGPICMASISSIDAVLNREQHDYLYFCAKGDGSSLHNFAKTLEGHNQNVAIYRRNLRERGLR